MIPVFEQQGKNNSSEQDPSEETSPSCHEQQELEAPVSISTNCRPDLEQIQCTRACAN